ncbi:MAG: DNA/RNA non-specific endonuclease, partial [Prevotella sp.]|nr:DNA/RNA non-specific endonuclease [Prevotella sp.]
MKKFFYFFAVAALVACGGGSDSPEPQPKPTPTPTPAVGNANKNDASSNAYLARLEMPKTKDGSKVITHTTDDYGVTFSLEWDSKIRAQRWTCYDLNKRNAAKNGNTRKSLWPDGDPWDVDPDVPKSEQQATYSELSKSYYPGSNDYYEKGHVCPSNDRLYTKAANKQTFYMTNILPMVGKFNGKLWQKMELQVNSWAQKLGDGDTIFVCKGGTIDKADQILGKTIGNHVVPKYFFMALYAKTSTGQKMLGFRAEHLNEDKSGDALKGYVVSIDELEQKLAE